MKPIKQKDIDSLLLLPRYFESISYSEREKKVVDCFLLAKQFNQGKNYWSQKQLKWNLWEKKNIYYFPIQGKWLYIGEAYYNFLQDDFKLLICDLQIPTLFKPLKIERIYQKSNRKVGWFGMGWRTEFESFCKVSNDYLEVSFYDGCQEVFQRKDKKWENVNSHSLAQVVSIDVQQQEIIVEKKGIVYIFYWDGRLKKIGNLYQQFFQLFYQDGTSIVSHIQTSCHKKIYLSFMDGKIEKVTDFYGRTLKYYYTSDYLSEMVQMNGQKYQYHYDTDTQTLRQILNPENQSAFQIELTKDCKIKNVFADNQMEWKLQSHPREFQFQLTNVKNNQKLSYTYTQEGYIQDIYLNSERLYHMLYDDLGNLIQLENRRNRVLTFQYNKKKQCVYKSWANHWREYHYHADGSCYKIKDDHGFETVLFYNKQRKIIQKRQLIAQGVLRTVEYTYDMRGRKETFIDANKNQIQYLYENDTQVFPSKIIFPNQYTIENNYDPLERIILREDQNGTVAYKYNKMGLLVKTIFPNQLEDFVQYDALGKIKEIISPGEWKYSKEQKIKPRGFRFQYDLSGKLQSIIDPEGALFSVAQGNEEKRTEKVKAYMHVNFIGKPVEVWTPYLQINGKEYYQFSQFQYDKNMNCVQHRIGQQWVKKKEKPVSFQTINYAYDDRGNLVHIHTSSGMDIHYFYQGQSKCIKMKQKIKNTLDYIVAYKYNESGLLYKKIERLHRDDLDSSIQITLSNDAVYVYIETLFSYDEEGNLISILFPDKELVMISYHANGEIKTPTYLKGLERTVYEELGLSNKKTHQIIPQSVEYDFIYNLNGQMIQATAKSPTLLTKRYDYNALGHVERISDERGDTKIIYGSNHRIAEILFPNQTRIRLSYDAANNITAYVDPEENYYIYEYNSINKIKAIYLNGERIKSFTYEVNGQLYNPINLGEFSSEM